MWMTFDDRSLWKASNRVMIQTWYNQNRYHISYRKHNCETQGLYSAEFVIIMVFVFDRLVGSVMVAALVIRACQTSTTARNHGPWRQLVWEGVASAQWGQWPGTNFIYFAELLSRRFGEGSVAQGLRWRVCGRGRPKAEAVCRHCIHILTTEMMKIRNCVVKWLRDSRRICFIVDG